MTEILKDKLVTAAEKLGWSVCIDESGIWEFEQYTPENEDFIFTVDGDDVVSEVNVYARDFDPDEHVMMWADQAGRDGVPDIRRLIDDADAIKTMLRALSDELRSCVDDVANLYDIGEVIFDITTCIPRFTGVGRPAEGYAYDSRDLCDYIFSCAHEFTVQYPDIGDDYMDTVEEFAVAKLREYFELDEESECVN